MKQLTEEEFYEQFTIQENHITHNESFGGLYETYGEELDYVFNLAQKENRVWTIIECDSDDELDDEGCLKSLLYFASGFHIVNRLGFIITNETYDEEIEVKLD